jgi:hypothetical protein
MHTMPREQLSLRGLKFQWKSAKTAKRATDKVACAARLAVLVDIRSHDSLGRPLAEGASPSGIARPRLHKTSSCGKHSVSQSVNQLSTNLATTEAVGMLIFLFGMIFCFLLGWFLRPHVESWRMSRVEYDPYG